MTRWIIPADATTSGGLRREPTTTPDPGPGEVRIAVGALSINRRDSMILAGPFGRTAGADLVPLSDVAGEIEAIGPEVTGWSVGDRVMTAHVPSWPDGPAPEFGPGPGSFDDPGVAADRIVVDADRLIATPTSLDDGQAATLQVAGVTAWNALFAARPVSAGDRVLVFGSGGVALYATQLARAAGAEVVAAVRGAADDPRWAELGVAQVLSTGEPGWGARLRAEVGGASKVVNSVGSNLLGECVDATAGSGEVALVGLMDMSPPPLNAIDLIGRQISVRGVAVGSMAMHRDLAAFMTQHGIKPVVDRRVGFDQLPSAFDAQAGSGLFGKIVIELNR